MYTLWLAPVAAFSFNNRSRMDGDAALFVLLKGSKINADPPKSFDHQQP
jgi:hypothetical protein